MEGIAFFVRIWYTVVSLFEFSLCKERIMKRFAKYAGLAVLLCLCLLTLSAALTACDGGSTEMSIAREVVEFEENNIEKLKGYL